MSPVIVLMYGASILIRVFVRSIEGKRTGQRIYNFKLERNLEDREYYDFHGT
ncbi:MAG: hypothetical protein Q6373_021080 [Candidatus Sigynarchaeota archaeon]